MATLTWQDNSIPIYPWDTTPTILYRIREKEKVPSIVYLQVKQDFQKIINDIDWDDNDVEIHIDVVNLTRGWDQPDMITTMKNMDPTLVPLYVRYKTEIGDIDEQLWETLFRYEFKNISFPEWLQLVKQEKTIEKQEEEEARNADKIYKELSIEEQKNIMGWKSEKHRIHCQVQDLRSMGELFLGLQLGNMWRLAFFYQKLFQWGEEEKWIVKMRRLKDPTLDNLVQEILETRASLEPGIYLYHQDFDTPVYIRPSGKNSFAIEIETSNDYPDLPEKVRAALEIGNIDKQTDVGMVGHFIFPKLYIDIPLFQDMCMNDPVVSHFLHVNELQRASFDNQIGVNFHQNLKDTLEIETVKQYDFSLKNTHRQSGFQTHVYLHTPISEKNLPIFFLFLRQIMGRYVRRREEILQLYSQFIPSFNTLLEKTRNSLVKNIKSTRPEYISKYPRMFVRNLYSVICQKNLQPTLIREEDTYDLPQESYLLFPPQPVAEINPEYYYCPNKDYPYAGLKDMDLKGQDVFINLAPCCFNSPQDKENERKLSKIRTKDDMEQDEKEKKIYKANIISGKFLIKYPGQLGTIRPPSMNRIFMAYDPFAEYYRVGTEQSPSSLLHCMLTRRNMMGVNTPYDVVDVRHKISKDVDCVNACLQENPGLNVEQIRSDIADPNVYFDPRRFYRAVELYFGVRLLVFSKEQDVAVEDAHILTPFSMRTHYENHSDIPFTIVFEHWGGKTNILSRFKHPHCELIGFKTPTEPSMRFDFNPKGIYQLLDHVIYQFDGNQHIQSFYRKECWFFRHIIGQTTDPLGKVRWIHFQYYNQNFYAETYPPLAIQDDIKVGALPKDIPILNAKLLLRFLNKFDHWESIHVPDPNGDIIYWTVSQDNVLWKSLEENTKLRLTFTCRLETPQPSAIQDRNDVLRKYILTDTPSLMSFKPSQPIAPSIYHYEKIATTLSQLCISAFSFFLVENNIQQGATDIDVLLETFAKEKIKIDSKHVYPENYNIDGFFMKKKLIIPSQRFWEKMAFHIRWLMFYQPQYLFDPDKTTPNYFQEIHDFVETDPAHYYCDMDSLHNVLKYSVEDLYETVSCPIDDLPRICKERSDMYVMWYNKDISPYPHPSLVVLFSNYTMTQQAVHLWRREHRIVRTGGIEQDKSSIYDWEPSLRLWKPSLEDVDMEEESLFRARVGTDYLLFFPIENTRQS